MIAQMMPFLSRYLPAGLAIKGISKVNPKLADFITTATSAGYTADSIIDFLRSRTETQGIKSERQRLQEGATQGTLRPDEMSNLQRLTDQGPSKLIAGGIGTGLGGAAALLGGGSGQEMPEEAAVVQQTAQQPMQQHNIIEQYSPELHQFILSHTKQGRSPLEAGALAQLDKKFMNVIKKIESDHKAPFSAILESIFGSAMQPQKAAKAPQGAAGGQQGIGSGQAALMRILEKIQQARAS